MKNVLNNQITSSQTFLNNIMCEHKVTPVVFRWSRFVPKNNFPVHGTPLTTKIINSAQYYMKAVCFWMHVCIIRELSMYAEINNKQQTNSHFSGGVIVIVWAVNSSSKYLVSVSDDTWGLKGGISWGRRRGGWKKKKNGAPVCADLTLHIVWRAGGLNLTLLNRTSSASHCVIWEGSLSDSDLL